MLKWKTLQTSILFVQTKIFFWQFRRLGEIVDQMYCNFMEIVTLENNKL